MTGHAAPGKLPVAAINRFRKDMLAWYDEHRRTLPWRAPSGHKPDPYQVWLSEIMLQQTVVAAVIPYFIKFIKNWPTVFDLAAAPQDKVMAAWAGLGYYARARNLHKCAKELAYNCNGIFPADEKALKALPGIGDYTSAAIRSIAFDLPATVVDGNVERVVARYFGVEEPLPDGKKILKQYAAALSEGREDRPGDFAQAMMDLGATVCTPQSPSCHACPVRKDCKARAAGVAEELPRRAAKKPKPQKIGNVYWLTDAQGRVLCEKRPETAMLGGMVGFPTSEWIVKKGRQAPSHPVFAKGLTFRDVKEIRVFHSFTHFDLELRGYVGEIKDDFSVDPAFFWVKREDIANVGLPTLFKKFVAFANMV